jgi:hypothetical protein
LPILAEFRGIENPIKMECDGRDVLDAYLRQQGCFFRGTESSD